MVGAGGGRLSVFCIFTGRWSVFIFENGRCRCLNQYMVGGRWLMVGGWSAGGGFVLRPSTILAKFESHMRLIKSRNMEHNFDCTYQIIHNIG